MIKNQPNKNRNRIIPISTKSNSYVREHLGTDSDGSPRTPRKIITESVYDENRHMSINNDYSPKRVPIEKIRTPNKLRINNGDITLTSNNSGKVRTIISKEENDDYTPSSIIVSHGKKFVPLPVPTQTKSNKLIPTINSIPKKKSSFSLK